MLTKPPHVELEALEITITNPFSQQVGTQKLTAEQIKNRPTGNGNITELFKSNPNVQFANATGTSNMGGEIAPNEVSIHGEKFYNNNYTIDGISNNDNINPASEVLSSADGTPQGNSATDLPSGGTQSFWLDKSLVKDVEIFDSNISAKYGNFTGGVINANLKDADTTSHRGQVYYRTTRDDWAEFHIQDNQQENFNRANRMNRQPKFTKHQFGININQPISDKTALLLSYNQTRSDIPYYHDYMNVWDNQERQNQNLLLSGNHLMTNGDKLKATFMYSPHQSTFVKRNVKDGGFSNKGGGYRLSFDWDKKLAWATMKSQFAWRKTRNQVKHDKDTFHNYLKTDRFDWQSSANSSQIGGYGTYATQKQTFTLKQDFNLNKLNTKDVEHQINLGWQADFAQAKYQRDSDVYGYVWRRAIGANTRATCADELCYQGEQFVGTYSHYSARNLKADDDTYSIYVEDNLKYKNLSASLGLRADYNRYLDNLNIAPRFSWTYNLNNNEKTRIFGGLNRYYSNSMLSYKMRDGIGYFEQYTRNAPNISTWTKNPRNGTVYEVKDLKTPYSDEINLGIAQQMFGTLWTAKWVKRKSHDTFVAVSPNNGLKYLTNDGYSKSDTFSLTVKPLSSLQFKYADVDFLFGANYNKTTTNTVTYENTAEDNDLTAIILDGQLKDVHSLPNLDYNSPWTTFLDINTYFPAINLDFNQHLKYKAGYVGYSTQTGTCPTYNTAICGNHTGKIQEFTTRDVGSHFLLDWNFNYQKPLSNGHTLGINLDIENVLNRKIIATQNSTGSISTYKMGRNFWLGVSYNW